MPVSTRISVVLALTTEIEDPNSAWGDFVDHYGPLILHWARGHSGKQLTSEEILQAVLCRLFKSIRKHSFYNVEKHGHFKAWLRTVYRNAVADCFRDLEKLKRERNGHASEFAISITGTEDALYHLLIRNESVEEQRYHQINEALNDLVSAGDISEKEHGVFVDSRLNGLPTKQVAEKYAIGAPSVYVYCQRTIEAIRHSIESKNTIDQP